MRIAHATTQSMRRPVLELDPCFAPIHITTARHALGLIARGKAAIVVETGKVVYPGFFMPSVIRLTHTRKKIPYRAQSASRKNILERDGYCCQYCGKRFAAADLTLDHVVPRCQGGERTWENLVAACGPCNRRKGGRTPLEADMRLLRRILPATVYTSRYILRSRGMHEPEWKKYLFVSPDEGDHRLIYREAA